MTEPNLGPLVGECSGCSEMEAPARLGGFFACRECFGDLEKAKTAEALVKMDQALSLVHRDLVEGFLPLTPRKQRARALLSELRGLVDAEKRTQGVK